ncbi:Sm-like ribonucleoprotein [Meredithblackwellia eburnea MCA 4105]
MGQRSTRASALVQKPFTSAQDMLPLALLHAAQAKPMLVELKNGETFNGHLVGCDNFMNLTLKEVYQTSADGEKFWKLAECYVRGNNLIDQVKEQEAEQRQRGNQGGGRGGKSGPGGGDRGRGGARGGRGGDRGRGRGGDRGRGGKPGGR